MPEGRAGHMVFYLKMEVYNTAALDSNMDRSIGTIAAWIVKYTQRPQSDRNDIIWLGYYGPKHVPKDIP